MGTGAVAMEVSMLVGSMSSFVKRYRCASLAIACCVAPGLAGCASGGGGGNTRSIVPNTSGDRLGTAEHVTNAVDAGTSDASVAMPSLPPVAIVVGASREIPAGTNPRVAITAPRDNTTLRTNRLEVRLRVTDWPAPQEGRHIHLIVDNEPYQRVDDPSRPVVLENLSEGTHVLRAFPGWNTHESVKRDGAFALAIFHVGRRTENFAFNRTAPLLTYSRPKGDYQGADAEHILLDFYITNVPANALGAAAHRVRYAIDGQLTGEATAWVPHYIDHLPDGEHRIALDLLGPDGQPVAGPFNHTERTIRVNRGAATPPPHGHAPAAP